MTTIPDLSIIIVTYNPGTILFDCLRSLPDGLGGLSAEVIIVDNNSQDGTPAHLAAEFPHIRLIANPDNRGFAAANNQGLRVAAGKTMLLCNPDVVVKPDALLKMFRFLETNQQVGIVGPRTYDAEGRIALSARAPYAPSNILWQFIGLDRLFPYRVYGKYRRACETATAPFDVGWLSGCCLMFPRTLYERIGGLDEQFFLFSEETDFCTRAGTAGLKVTYLPDAEITHFESRSTSQYPKVTILHYHLSALYFFRKRNRHAAVLMLKFGFTAELALKSLVRLVMGIRKRKLAQAMGFLRLYASTLMRSWRY